MDRAKLESRGSVGYQVLRYIVAISLAFISLSSAALFMVVYSGKKAVVEREIEVLRASQAPGIAEGLWNYDADILQALADGICNYPYVNRVSISDDRGFSVSSGVSDRDSASLSFPLTRSFMGARSSFGRLELEIDSERILRDSLSQTLPVIGLEIIFLAVESVVVLYLLSRMATRHLARIVGYIREFDVRPGVPPLRLDKKDRGDELDLLVRAYNAMREDVAAARSAEGRAMEELKLSEERNRILVEEAPDAIMMYDAGAGTFVDCNRRAEQLFGRSREELVGSRPEESLADESVDGLTIGESVRRHTAAVLAGERVEVLRRVLRPGGEVIDCEVRLNLLPFEEGARILRVSYLDVTQRARAERALARSLREKEILIDEIYHRTNNNMQLIAALFELELTAGGDARATAIMNDMIGRITSIALVYRKLVDSKDLSRIDLGDYTGELVSAMRASWLKGIEGVDISVEAEPGIIALIDLAVPFGLVLNELVANAARHAFPGRRSGRVRVSLRRPSPGTIALTVSDDGAGLPPGFDFRRDGRVGLRTVVSIVEQQLRGGVSFSSGPGTTCEAMIRDDFFEARL